MESIQQIIDNLLHIDVYLNTFVSNYGFWTYLALFLVIFCETGLVITPFLPGDSLLFAAGSITAQPGNSLNIFVLFFLLMVAATLGNQVNFFIGRFIGPRVFHSKSSRFFNSEYLNRTHLFYEKHGGKTLFFARFIPIIRSFAPFVAGIGSMAGFQFSLYNLLSALLWIGSLLGLGYFLGSLTIVQEYFSLIIYSIILISILPPLVTFFYRSLSSRMQ